MCRLSDVDNSRCGHAQQNIEPCSKALPLNFVPCDETEIFPASQPRALHFQNVSNKCYDCMSEESCRQNPADDEMRNEQHRKNPNKQDYDDSYDDSYDDNCDCGDYYNDDDDGSVTYDGAANYEWSDRFVQKDQVDELDGDTLCEPYGDNRTRPSHDYHYNSRPSNALVLRNNRIYESIPEYYDEPYELGASLYSDQDYPTTYYTASTRPQEMESSWFPIYPKQRLLPAPPPPPPPPLPQNSRLRGILRNGRGRDNPYNNHGRCRTTRHVHFAEGTKEGSSDHQMRYEQTDNRQTRQRPARGARAGTGFVAQINTNATRNGTTASERAWFAGFFWWFWECYVVPYLLIPTSTRSRASRTIRLD